VGFGDVEIALVINGESDGIREERFGGEEFRLETGREAELVHDFDRIADGLVGGGTGGAEVGSLEGREQGEGEGGEHGEDFNGLEETFTEANEGNEEKGGATQEEELRMDTKEHEWVLRIEQRKAKKSGTCKGKSTKGRQSDLAKEGHGDSANGRGRGDCAELIERG
jgi:hypothetical protein